MVELRVTWQREMRRYGLEIECTEEQWDRTAQRFNNKKKGHTAHNATLGRTLETASRVVDELVLARRWNWHAFDRWFLHGEVDEVGELLPLDVATYLDGIEKEMEDSGRDGNAAVYRDCARTVRRYAMGKPLLFDGLTMEVLYAIDKMMRKGGANDGGISVFMRTLRAAVNRAMKDGLVNPDRYPFATSRTRGYEMKVLKKKKVSRALGDAEMSKFKKFPFAKYPRLARSVVRFLIIYYARGMNFVDLANLRDTDIHGSRIRYSRQKTVRRSTKVLSIHFNERLAELFERAGRGTGGYLLDILRPEHRTSKQQRHRIQKCLKEFNADMKKAAAIVGITGNVTSYVARHTYAMRMKTKGVDIGKISEALGHSSVANTEPYMAQFENPVIDATDELL